MLISLQTEPQAPESDQNMENTQDTQNLEPPADSTSEATQDSPAAPLETATQSEPPKENTQSSPTEESPTEASGMIMLNSQPQLLSIKCACLSQGQLSINWIFFFSTGKKKKPKMLNKFDKTIKSEIDAAEKLRKKV